jgi:hypothetical protein
MSSLHQHEYFHLQERSFLDNIFQHQSVYIDSWKVSRHPYNLNKEAEIFTLVIAGTVEANWFANSHPDKSKYITIDEVELEKVLNHEEFKTYQKPIPKMSFRF